MARTMWTMEETQMLVEGCNRHGIGSWKAMLNDPSLHFDNRISGDLKDRFRTHFPDAYKQHYPNAKTHRSSIVRSSLPDGTSIFKKTRSKKRRPFTKEEDHALKAGYDKHGAVWAAIVKDPIFQKQSRRSTDIRDRFRHTCPDLYQAAGYKPRGPHGPRNSAKKKPSAASHTVTGKHLHASHETGPAHCKQRYTTQGFLQGGTKSVPLSPNSSEEEESLGDDDDDEYMPKYAVKRSSHPEPMRHVVSDICQQQGLVHFCDVGIPSTDSMAIPTILPSTSQSGMTDSSHPEMMSSSTFHGVTHYSSYAGDHIFGTHTHQPLSQWAIHTHTFLNPTNSMRWKQTDSHVVAHPSTTLSSSHFDPSEALFPNAAQESSSVFLPQEREIMADITLDLDDPNGPFISNSTAAAGTWVWAALTSEPTVDNDASSQAMAWMVLHQNLYSSYTPTLPVIKQD